MHPETNIPPTTPRSSEPDAKKERQAPPHERLALSKSYIRETVDRAVLESDEYFRLRALGQPDAAAFPEAARMLSESSNDIDPFDRSLIGIASHLGVFIDAEQELNSRRGFRNKQWRKQHRDFESNEVRIGELKEDHIIPFNRQIKELIDENPQLKIDDLARNLATAYVAIYSGQNNLHPEQPRAENPPIEYDVVVDNLHKLIDGMRHELAAETLLSAAGIPYRYKTTIEQDRSGRDLYVELDGHWVGVDIKASLTAEQNAHLHRDYSKATWTGLYPEDFTGIKGDRAGSVSISFDVAKKKCGDFVDRLRRMQNGKLATEHSRIRTTGSHALRAVRH